MTDAYTEFLNENSQRRYPLTEDCVPSFGDGVLPDSILLDARGFSRERPDLAPSLILLAGPSSGAPQALAGFFTMVFQAGRQESPLQFVVRIAQDQVQWPLSVSCPIADPNYAGSLLAGLRVTVGPSILDLDPATLWSFSSAPLEPSLVASLYRTQVDQLRLVHQDQDAEYVGGELLVTGGYNVEVVQAGSLISIRPSPGAGELGRYIGALLDPADSSCNGRVMTINRIGPTKRGEFFIRKGKGIDVINLPAQHKIIIKPSLASLPGGRC